MEGEGVRLAHEMERSVRRRGLVAAVGLGGLVVAAGAAYALWYRNLRPAVTTGEHPVDETGARMP